MAVNQALSGTSEGGYPMIDILIVDDDVQTRAILRIVLTGHGYTVAEAENGETALVLVVTQPVRVVVADLHMPRMDGVTFAQRLRVLPFTHIPHLIIMSASVPAHLIDVGQCATLRKPFDVADLVVIITSLLSHASDHEEERWAG
jgi:CheY-like chemotaxis protein